MEKRVYISADYSEDSGDREVVDLLNIWGSDQIHKTSFVDMAKVVSGSITINNPDCRICDIKQEFNQQIKASSAVIIVVGDKTKDRIAGNACQRAKYSQYQCHCTPYKQNVNGEKPCKVISTTTPGINDDIGSINSYSYLRHEFEQAKRRNKPIIVLYNSLRKENDWLPCYLKEYESIAQPFWTKNAYGDKIGNYSIIKKELGYD